MTARTYRSMEALRSAVVDGKHLKYLYFWGHKPARGGRLSKSCLSQWWPARFVVAGHEYLTAEHFMMAEKARLFGDEDALGAIQSSTHPGEAKRLGREVLNFEESVWVKERFEIVVAGNVAKFGQNPELRDFLLSTASRVLVEASPRDRIWGIGLSESDPRASDPLQWEGENLLGFALMEARAELARGRGDVE